MQQMFTVAVPLPQLVETARKTDPAAAQDAGALCRMLCRHAGAQCADPVTGLPLRAVAELVFGEQAAGLAAAGPGLSVAMVRVPEHAGLVETESDAAAARCLSAAAGVLQTAVDATWPNAAVARWGADTFAVIAAADRQTLENAGAARAVHAAVRRGRLGRAGRRYLGRPHGPGREPPGIKPKNTPKPNKPPAACA